MKSNFKTQLKLGLLIAPISLILWYCGSKHEPLKVKLYEASDTFKKDSVYTFNENYFEISLYSMTYKSGEVDYMAKRDLKEYTMESPSIKQLIVVGQNDSTMNFTDSNEFLNFMSAKGYKLDQKKEFKYRTDYTFVKSTE